MWQSQADAIQVAVGCVPSSGAAACQPPLSVVALCRVEQTWHAQPADDLLQLSTFSVRTNLIILIVFLVGSFKTSYW